MGRVSWNPGATVSPEIAWNQDWHFLTSLISIPFCTYAPCFYFSTDRISSPFQIQAARSMVVIAWPAAQAVWMHVIMSV